MHTSAILHIHPAASTAANRRAVNPNCDCSTAATLHAHPAIHGVERIFEIRRLARESGCIFIANKHKRPTHSAPAPFDPNDGGSAA